MIEDYINLIRMWYGGVKAKRIHIPTCENVLNFSIAGS